MTELVATRGDALQRYAMLLCGSHEQAADLVQDALVKTFGRLRNGFSVESAEAYVRRAILNGHLDGGRRITRWRRIAPLEYVPDEQPPATGMSPPGSTCTGTAQALPAGTRLPGPALLRRPQGRRHRRDARHQLRRGQALPERRARQMAIALADDGTAADRLGPAGARPAPENPAPGEGAQWPANLSCATGSTRARCPRAGSMSMPCCAVTRPAPAAHPPRRRRLCAGDRRDRGPGDDRQLRAPGHDSAIPATAAVRRPEGAAAGCGGDRTAMPTPPDRPPAEKLNLCSAPVAEVPPPRTAWYSPSSR